MKILYCVNRFPSTTQTFVLTQLRAMRRRGHEIHVHALQRDPSARAHATLPVDAVCHAVHYAPVLPGSKTRRVAAAARAGALRRPALTAAALDPRVFGTGHACSFRRLVNVLDFAGVVASVRPDVVHVHFATNAEAPLCCRRVGLLDGIGWVVTFHGFDLEARASFYPALFRAADRFTVNSSYTRGLATAMGCPGERTVGLPMGIDLEVFRPPAAGRPEVGPLGVLFVGRLVEMKGPDLALRVFARLLETTAVPCRLHLIGEGPLRGQLERLASGLGVADRVTFAGACPQEEVREALACAAVFLLPGRTGPGGREENQGVVLQEAQAMRIPVVAAAVGGVAEGMEDGGTGFLVPPGDVAAAAAAVKRLVEDAGLRRAMGVRGRELVGERFDAAGLAERLETVYKTL
jgi:colanic acid/amylovoran biosynthesis glycosyltransferase